MHPHSAGTSSVVLVSLTFFLEIHLHIHRFEK